MNGSVIGLLIVLLTLAVAFNLFLTLRMARIVGHHEYLRSPIALPAGTPLPAFKANALADGRRVRAEALDGQPAVLVFLSPGCGDCKARVGEIARMYPAMRQAGVALWVIGPRSGRRLAQFLAGTPLLDRVLRVSTAAQRKLNPRNAAPFYIFIDHQRTVLASNFIGDDDWLSFVAQMREVDPEAAPAS